MIKAEQFRFCRMCDIIGSIPGDIGVYADRLYNLLEEEEKADEDLIRSRNTVCEECVKNVGGTCLACGCYCIIRSMKRSSHCPDLRW